MKFQPSPLEGAWMIELDLLLDDRGHFCRSYCQREFKDAGIEENFVQCNISYNKHKGTLRGMHFQTKPFEEAKLVRCCKGAVYDVILDLRTDSKTYCSWYGVTLSDSNKKMLYIPKGFAHGFQTLTEDAELFYQMSEYYIPTHSSGVRWNDPAFNIDWPLDGKIISEKDQCYPDFLPCSRVS